MTVERSRITLLLGGLAMVATLGPGPARAAAPEITVYRDPT
jgi:hypothetical protein